MAETVQRRPPIPPDMYSMVVQRAGGVCQKCGSDDRCEVDHIIPWHIVKEHQLDNLQLLCLGCNRSKGGKVEADGRKTWFHSAYWPTGA